MARWSALSEALREAGPSVRLSWLELDRIVGGLPPSASKYRAWWSGDRPHVRTWRSAGYTIANLVIGHEVTFVRIDEPALARRGASRPRPGASRVEDQASRGREDGSDLLLVTCVKTKLAVPAAARDLYTSALFQKERAYAERRGVPWFIVSAEHGLVAPDEWLAPYERYLPDTPAAYREAWGAWVAERLDLLAGPLDGAVVEIHAGSAYLDSISKHLTAKGAKVLNPLEGLTMGERLAWYDSKAAPSAPSVRQSPTGGSHIDAARFVEALRTPAAAMTPAEVIDGQGVGLKRPGLYSWWVDEEGAAELTAGLELQVLAGLIYAGLAGATRWPSGRRSRNTLWSRISGMHLGSRHEFSTFRRTLGAVLANASGSDSINEIGLTAWMHGHLKVVAVPYDDADTLGRLEEDVLKTLDPPLNLKGMTPTPIRLRLTQLRRRHR